MIMPLTIEDLVEVDLGEVSIENAFDMFPALNFFEELTHNTTARIITGLLMQGFPENRLQEMVDSTFFIISLAGSVYSQIQRIPNYGYDSEHRHDRD